MLKEQISRYKSLDLFARQVVEGFITGRHRSPLHGFSVEFSDYRHYNPGESTAHIDWRLYGRTDRLFVKQYQEETNLRCQILIDQSSSMLFPLEGHGYIDPDGAPWLHSGRPGYPNKITFAAYAAAVLIEILHRQRDAFGLTLLSDGVDLQTPCRSNATHQRHLYSLLDQLLQPFQPSNPPTLHPTNIAPSLHLIAEQLHRRSLVVIFTDALLPHNEHEHLIDALRHLRHNRHEVILFHTFDRQRELQLAFDNRPHRFIDLESRRTLQLNPAEIADAYRREMESQQTRLQHLAMQYRVDYIPVDTAQGFHQVMLPFLLKRSKI